MKVKNFFPGFAWKDQHYAPYAAAFGSITPYCNCTTSNLMATALNDIHSLDSQQLPTIITQMLTHSAYCLADSSGNTTLECWKIYVTKSL